MPRSSTREIVSTAVHGQSLVVLGYAQTNIGAGGRVLDDQEGLEEILGVVNTRRARPLRMNPLGPVLTLVLDPDPINKSVSSKDLRWAPRGLEEEERKR